jgi:hypothetical protein
MSRFVLQNTFIKEYIFQIFRYIFYKNKKSKLCFGDRVVVLNVKLFGMEGVLIHRQMFHPFV